MVTERQADQAWVDGQRERNFHLTNYAAAAAQPRSETMYETQACAPERRAQGLAAGAGALAKVTSSPVQESLDQLASAQNRLGDRLDALHGRLEPLLGPSAPQAECGPQAGRPASSQFDECLQFRVNAELRSIDRIEDLLRRLSI